ncbi:uncharacterized protein LOC124444586 [Xenia sp. Carnegie-2017]|uniref:uncharacterized protein LOC124444586 n=1 Tax=Xenia sp. Carnegie-2017 TaxID=2897299 RepID=UPI001F03A8B7|nr:uncharacterized protein LOC124444586 [Xenia sp. Carnegie-2017]
MAFVWMVITKSDGHTLNSLILAADYLDNSAVVTDRDELTISLKRFCKSESVDIDSFDSENSPEEQDFVRNIRFTGTRYEVGLPWKNDHVQIDDDYELCHNRLRSLHQKLLKDPQNLEEYINGITEQLVAGIVERVPASDKDCGKIHYLPHHCVIRKDKVTTKLRVVYDGSATTNLRNFSLNDCLLTGPNLIPQIFDLLVKFPQNKIGLGGDIEKAFLMIGIDKEDRDMLRFLWLRDARDPHSEVLKLRFCRLVFGLRPSPAILGATINHHLKTHEKQEPETVEHLKNSLYVNDFVSGAETDETALQIYKGTKQLMAKGGFNWRKWISNSSNVVKSIEALDGNKNLSLISDKSSVIQDDQSFTKSAIAKESLLTEPTQVKVLGMVCDTVEDTFLFNLTEIIEYANSLPVTK